MNKERVLVLGTGQAGGNIADIFAQNGYDTLVFNTANSDLDKLKNVKNKVIVGDTEGSGKNPNLSKENFQKELSRVQQAIEKATKYKELVLIPFGSGGGTGRGSAELLAKEVKNLGKIPWMIKIKPFENEGNFMKANNTSFVMGFEKIKNEYICFPFMNTDDHDGINKYIFTCFDELINNGNLSENVFDFRDMMNAVRPGYNYLGRGMGNQIKIHSDELDNSQSKYATLIKTSKSKEDGYGLLNTLNLGNVDRNFYHIQDENEKWLLLLGGMSLNREYMTMAVEETNKTVAEHRKTEETLSLNMDNLW